MRVASRSEFGDSAGLPTDALCVLATLASTRRLSACFRLRWIGSGRETLYRSHLALLDVGARVRNRARPHLLRHMRQSHPMTGRQLTALRIADPAKWERIVRSALRNFPTVASAAPALGVSWRTLMRWRAELEISADCK